MKRSYSSINMNKVDHLWIIKDFTDFFKFIKNSYYIESIKFDIDGNKECRFSLKMLFTSDHIACCLVWPKKEHRLSMAGQISIIGQNNEKIKTINVETDYDAVDENRNSLPLKIERNDLVYKALDLFPDNKLKVLCSLRIFDDYDSTKSLTSSKHHRSIKDHLKEILNSQVGSDIVIEVDGQEFKAHKTILIARSPVFLTMFNNDVIEKSSNRIKIEDISSSVFKLLMEFIYTDEITTELDLETGMDLLKAASKYQLEGLEVLCGEKLSDLLTVNNVMDILLMAETHNCADFVKSIENFVKVHQKEVHNIIKPEHFLQHPNHISLFITKKDT